MASAIGELRAMGENVISSTRSKFGFASNGHKSACFWISGAVILCFVIFCVGAFFYHHDAPLWVKVLAATFSLTWAVGTPSWFWFERLHWRLDLERKQIDIDKQQDRVRDFWLGLGAIVLLLSDHILFPH